MLGVFVAIWIGFAVYGRRKQEWSGTISIGGGFIVGLLVLLVVAIVVPSARVAAPPTEAASEPVEIDLLPTATATGLLGLPLPEGARLVEQQAGDPANFVDPMEQYEIDADRRQIMDFYRFAMEPAGWKLDSAQNNSRFYKKGQLMVGILTNNEGQTFTLIGS